MHARRAFASTVYQWPISDELQRQTLTRQIVGDKCVAKS
jgi:hypothetical protein